ncbi:hypothetical protein LIA77_09941 [Sarocladium implicatum]|nr:hypothetical protein LIA77_09941 [Sarocladium implicatum]
MWISSDEEQQIDVEREKQKHPRHVGENEEERRSKPCTNMLGTTSGPLMEDWDAHQPFDISDISDGSTTYLRAYGTKRAFSCFFTFMLNGQRGLGWPPWDIGALELWPCANEQAHVYT